MVDLAVITAAAARDRVAEQFEAATPETPPAPRVPARSAAARILRALANRLEPAPRYVTQA